MSQEALKKLVNIASNQQKELKKLAQLIDWDRLHNEYRAHLLEAAGALSDAADYLEQLRTTMPHASEALNMRIQRLYHFKNEITQLQDDIHYGLKPAVQSRTYEDE